MHPEWKTIRMRIRKTIHLNPRARNLDQLLNIDKPVATSVVGQVDSRWFRPHEIQLFATEGQSGGEKWQKLSPRYAKWKLKRFRGRRILVRSGKMRKAFVTRSSPEHVADAFRLPGSGWTLRFGARNKVAQYHKTGSHVMPSRPPILVTSSGLSEAYRAVREAILPHILRAITAKARSI